MGSSHRSTAQTSSLVVRMDKFGHPNTLINRKQQPNTIQSTRIQKTMPSAAEAEVLNNIRNAKSDDEDDDAIEFAITASQRGMMSASLNSYLDTKTRLLEKREAEAQEAKVHKSEDDLLDSIDPNLRATVALAESFKRVTDALGGDRVTAAKMCSAFKKFLKPDELSDLELGLDEFETD
mmetsp:Transcript_8694/g.19947  ORF Transcript_8694/g.19947 Transcript_8694/m.19947 type:complete len:179 (+) Transcript_8694:2-538(+)